MPVQSEAEDARMTSEAAEAEAARAEAAEAEAARAEAAEADEAEAAKGVKAENLQQNVEEVKQGDTEAVSAAPVATGAMTTPPSSAMAAQP